jgi:ATP-dependent Lon protease
LLFGFQMKTFMNQTYLNNQDFDSDFQVVNVEEFSQDEITANLPEVLPILPLRNMVLFPNVVLPITVGRTKSIKLAKEVSKSGAFIGVITQIDSNTEDPKIEDLHPVGTIARVVKMFKMPDGNNTVIIQGISRFRLTEITDYDPYLKARISEIQEEMIDEDQPEIQAMISSIKETALEVIEVSNQIPAEAANALKNITAPRFLTNFIASNLPITLEEKQSILEIDSFSDRSMKVLEFLKREFNLQEIKNRIADKVRNDIDQQQKEYFLHQQLKTIQEELGGKTPDLEVQNLRERGKEKTWPKEVADFFNKELDKLQRMNPAAADYSVVLNHVELLLDLPWNQYTVDHFDIKKAQKILDRDHFGLDKVKDRILEYLAVLKLKSDMKAPILCLVGPPGVGKTSLGRSISEAIGRKYIRMSLGGVRDEATIRGHRKTYIGAMPGRIIQSIKKAGSSNPVIILDEIDKVGSDFRGDISSALLEVLDPEQNATFSDHYLELDYDLSKVMFIATANSLSTIQPALLDRMEIIEINGYTMEEKTEIAKKYLVPKQLENHGLKKKDVAIGNQELEFVIDGYTRESGVRNLDKQIASLVRGTAKLKALGESFDKNMHKEDIRKILGIPRFEHDLYENTSVAGVVTGLAWTSVGGDILYIESTIAPGKGRLTITGNLGDVMKESASIALGYIKAHSKTWFINNQLFDHSDIHIHVPEGATPKDGPSAGITMLTSLISTYTQRQIKPGIAMTGEITLRGKVLPVGGIKEKILAAKRAGIKTIILCKENRKDIEEIRQDYIKDLSFVYVDRMEEVIDAALLPHWVENPIDIASMIPQDTPKA